MMAVQLDEVREHIIKNGNKKGQKMAFIKVSDSTCNLEGVICFTEAWETYKDLLIEGNTVMIGGSRDKKNTDTLIVNKVWQI
jgi:DNA polymerase III alpha subunit